MHNDVGRGIVRMDKAAMEYLGITSGDIVEVEGKKSTAAIVWPSHPPDFGLDIIRMDGLIRQNSDSSLGDKVRIVKSKAAPARDVTIAPTMHEIKFGDDFATHVKQRMINRPLVKGDKISIGVLGQAIPFVVIATNPKGVVQIQDLTSEKRTRPRERDDRTPDEAPGAIREARHKAA